MDREILNFIRDNIRADWLDPIMKFFTTIGNWGIYVLGVAIILLFFKNYRRAGIMIICCAVFGFIFNDLIIKNIIARPRPCQISPEFIHYTVACPTSYSMASGHTLQGLFAGYILFLNKKFKVGIPVFIGGLIIAFSRNYFAVHWPSDVLAGAILSFVIAFGIFSLFKYNKKLAKICVYN